MYLHFNSFTLAAKKLTELKVDSLHTLLQPVSKTNKHTGAKFIFWYKNDINISSEGGASLLNKKLMLFAVYYTL